MISTLLICAALSVNTTAGKELLAKTFTHYTNAKGLAMHYTITESGMNGQGQAHYYASGKNYFFDGVHYASLHNTKYDVHIDKDRHKITITEVQKSKTKRPMAEFETMLKQLDQYQIQTLSTGETTRIKIATRNSLVPYMFYDIDTKTETIKRVEYTSETGNKKSSMKTTMDYTNTEFDKEFSKDFFDEKNWIKKKDKTWVIVEAKFKGYKIVDLTN